mmetsp:Transcript_2957/g.2551  ORF Transcript_2957/g.2551 Transcript_2957/m.2551 type:complete len:168 (-) Transcript_2957:414-917(-)|eukprot:CAMPEP_0114581450 /NCGR_PEP_ID=MMETSP0125-20121206/5558_1 /TAXON_ID=485358 ORGANISM="Aristerostoma sp., Strain ATCC 50986" /NCGR_SAMPLE_ID=MMETSP0125 /ASSEMBLY_ACC=CAM_ASM_000245 /LENGTH=167 /DNA_ID=CAMNT_0001773669 /DNA_START=1556 /DNA_END=2059 /DNA_ORIENTATION=-
MEYNIIICDDLLNSESQTSFKTSNNGYSNIKIILSFNNTDTASTATISDNVQVKAKLICALAQEYGIPTNNIFTTEGIRCQDDLEENGETTHPNVVFQTYDIEIIVTGRRDIEVSNTGILAEIVENAGEFVVEPENKMRATIEEFLVLYSADTELLFTEAETGIVLD